MPKRIHLNSLTCYINTEYSEKQTVSVDVTQNNNYQIKNTYYLFIAY